MTVHKSYGWASPWNLVMSCCSLPVHTHAQGDVYTPVFRDLRSVEPEHCDLESCNWFKSCDIPEASSRPHSFAVQYRGLCPTLGSHVPVALGWSDLQPSVEQSSDHISPLKGVSPSCSLLLSQDWHTPVWESSWDLWFRKSGHHSFYSCLCPGKH